MEEPTKTWIAYMETLYTGAMISFGNAIGARMRGECIACEYEGFLQRGGIPDFKLAIQGKSGNVRSISLVESRARIKESID